MSGQAYFVLKIQNLPADAADQLSGELFAYGATGVQEDLPFKQEGEFYEVTELPREYSEVIAYFEKKPSEELTTWIQSTWPNTAVKVTKELPKDWLEEWKKGYVAFELIEGIFVVPSWLPTPSKAKAALKIDPGMAFGTGTHETTQLASKLISEVPNLNGKTVLDVGTGTGILALLCEKLGTTRVVGTEIDPEARRTARENMQLNESLVEISEVQIEQLEETFDFVIANIIDGVLVALQKEFRRCLKPGGYLLLTGILDERETGFRDRFDFAGYELIQRETKNEWVGYLLRENRQRGTE